MDGSKNRDVARFLATIVVLYICWFILHDFFLIKRTTVVYDLIKFEAKVSAYVLRMLPLNDVFDSFENRIQLGGRKLIKIGDECSALVLMVIFTGFIIGFPGNWKSKMWFIPLGILLLFIFNIIRIVLLALNKAYLNSIFAFNHHITFTYLMYAIIFGLWWFWMKKIRKTVSA